MPSPLKPSSSKHHQQHSDAPPLKTFMDRKPHNFNWLYTYPPPAAFSINGVTYMAPVPGASGENTGMSMPAFTLYTTDQRGNPNLHRQPAPQGQQEANGNHQSSSAAAATTNQSGNSPDTTPNDITNNSAALVPSRPTSPMTVDAAIQCLASQLQDAIRLCNASLKTHEDVVTAAQFTTEATRNAMWRDLLEHRFRASGFARDGFQSLGRRLELYMEAACRAAAAQQSGGRREAERRLRRMRLLRAECVEVVRLAEGATGDVLDCREMLALMKGMRAKMVGRRRSGNHSEDGEGSGDEDGEDQGDSSGDGVWTATN